MVWGRLWWLVLWRMFLVFVISGNFERVWLMGVLSRGVVLGKLWSNWKRLLRLVLFLVVKNVLNMVCFS